MSWATAQAFEVSAPHVSGRALDLESPDESADDAREQDDARGAAAVVVENTQSEFDSHQLLEELK
jgi:hypothetical protein